jgi:hypothetical protein
MPKLSSRSKADFKISDVMEPFGLQVTSASISTPRNVQRGAPGKAFPGPVLSQRLPLESYGARMSNPIRCSNVSSSLRQK